MALSACCLCLLDIFILFAVTFGSICRGGAKSACARAPGNTVRRIPTASLPALRAAYLLPCALLCARTHRFPARTIYSLRTYYPIIPAARRCIRYRGRETVKE